MKLTRSYEQILTERLKEKTPLIQVLIGPRQVGKSTAAQAIFEQWKGPKLMISADGPTPPTAEWIRWNWEKAASLGPNTLFIIDEVQKVVGWSEQIKIFFDKERGKGNLKILLLGSSSLYLNKGLTESLAGRFELVNASHWTFKECKEYFKWDLNKYLCYGGYPGAAEFAGDFSRWKNYILNSIIEPVLSRDILGSQMVANPALFRQTFEMIMGYPAQVVSLQKLLGQVQGRGNAATIKHYLSLFEKCFLILCLEKYSGSHLKTKASSPKIVILNPALVSAYQPEGRLLSDSNWYGRVFESLVGAHLSWKMGGELYYWKKGNFEVDYVIKTPGKTVAIEIKSGERKNGRGLTEFSKDYSSVKCELWDKEECLKFLNDI